MKNKNKVKLRSLNKKIAAEKLVTLSLAGLLATVGTLDNLGINLFDLLDNFKHNFNNPSSSTELDIDKTESYKPSDVKTDDEDVPVITETTEDKSKISDGEDIADKTEQAVNSDIQSPVSTGTLGEASKPSSNLDPDLKPEDTHIHTLGEWVALNGIFDASYCPEDGALAGVKLHNIRITNIKKISNENGTHNLVITFTCTNCGQEKTITKTVECKYGEEITWDDVFEYETCDCGYKHTIGRHNLDSGTINYQGKTIEYTCTNSRCGYKLVRDYNPTISVSPGSGAGGSGSSGSGHDKPTHIHYLGEWVSLNDDLEANYCPEDGVLVGTRAHKYDKPSNTAISNQDGTHTTTTSETCLNCNHIKTTTKTDSCNYNFKWNDTLEYNECSECGYIHIIGGHNLDKGTIDTVNNEITYKCQNEGCDYSKTESYTKPVDPTHKHIMGEWKDNGNNEARVCIAPGCTAPDKAIQTRPHSWGNYTYKDDSTEERHCNTCTAISTKGHSYTNSTSYSIVDDTHHTRTITRNCSSCNDSKIVDTFENENCSFTIFVSETDANITYKCACGNTKTVDKTVEHTHAWGEWINNGANEVRYCVAPGCSDPIAKENKPHSWGEWNADHTERNCKTCNAVETHTHTFGDNSTSYEKNGDTQHDVVVTHICSDSNCGKKEEVSRTTINCSFTTIISETDTTITKACVCGNTFTEDKNKEHNHTYGAWQDNGANEICYCTDPNCTVPGGDAKTQDHQWGEWNADHTERTCTSCGKVETHTHTYTNSDDYSPSGDKTHIHTITGVCGCGDTKEISRTEEGCSFTKGTEVTDPTTGITTITYSCVCGNYYTETKKPATHTHSGGSEQTRSGSGNVCYETYKVCAECGEEYDIASHGHNLIDAGRGKKECTGCGKTFGADGELIEQAALQNPPLATDIPAVGDVVTDGETLAGVIAGSGQGTDVSQVVGDGETQKEIDASQVIGDEETQGEIDASQVIGDGETQEEPGKVVIIVDESNEDKIDEIIAEQEEGKDIILVVDDEEEIVDQIISEQDQVISDAQAEAEARLEEILASDADEAAKDEAIDKIIEDTERIIGEAMDKADAEFADLIDDDPMVLELTM